MLIGIYVVSICLLIVRHVDVSLFYFSGQY